MKSKVMHAVGLVGSTRWQNYISEVIKMLNFHFSFSDYDDLPTNLNYLLVEIS